MQDSDMDGSAKSEGSWNLAGTSWPMLQPNPHWEAHVYKTEPLLDGQGYTSGWWVPSCEHLLPHCDTDGCSIK